jgi:hypothetical protein
MDAVKRKPGRPKGSKNALTMEKIREIQASGITPLDYLLDIMRDGRRSLEVRIDAAKSAAPYCHPRLAAVTHSGNVGARDISELTREQVQERIAALVRGTVEVAGGESESHEVH